MLDAPWTLSPEDSLAHFSVHADKGLSSDQAAKHAELYGRNGTRLSDLPIPHFSHSIYLELPEDPPTPLWELIVEQFKDTLVLILLASAVISFVLAFFESGEDSSFLGALVEPLVILLILVANATVGVVQEANAEKAIDVGPAILPEFFFLTNVS
jgi:Ca2+ transporting ATPase